MKWLISENPDRLDLTADKDYKKGDFFFKGGITGVAGFDVKEGEVGTFYISGIFNFDNVKSDDTADIGDLAYWDDDNKVITTDSNDGKNPYIGYFIKPKEDGDTNGEINLNG